ncbi:MAG: tRNA adenosine(34) deaminase TadA [Victivallales bacterium]|nr:tRNA adenosine(34) deaminase TadA [Victivallales bacterium]
MSEAKPGGRNPLQDNDLEEVEPTLLENRIIEKKQDTPIQINTPEACMRIALTLAKKAASLGEVPVGAVVLHDGKIIARAYNQVEMLKDATAHAEILAITQAEAAIEDWRLTECTLFVTKEPCAMCAGAMVNARLGHLVYACPDPRMGAAGSALNITSFPGMLHTVEVTSGLLEDEAREILQDFFRRRRAGEIPPAGHFPDGERSIMV